MKDIFYYAEKNGLTLLKNGNCQLCGSNVKHGIFECHENFCSISSKLNFSDPQNYLSRFLSVDSMALQHTEVHCMGSNFLHLTRLYLILEKKNKWTYSKTPLLSNLFNAYKTKQDAILVPPPVGQRGALTSFEPASAKDPKEIPWLIEAWAKNVFNAYQMHHGSVALLAEEYLKNFY